MKKLEVWCCGVRPKLKIIEVPKEIYNKAAQRDRSIANNLFDILGDENIDYIGCVYEVGTNKLLVDCCCRRER